MASGTIIAISALLALAPWRDCCCDETYGTDGPIAKTSAEIRERLQLAQDLPGNALVQELKAIASEIDRIQPAITRENQPVAADQRSVKTTLFLNWLNTAHRRMAPNIDEEPYPESVPVELLEFRFIGGTDLQKSIPDPVAREKIEAALRQGKETAQNQVFRRMFQDELTRLIAEVRSERLIPYLGSHYAEADPVDQTELESLFKEELKDDLLREQLVNDLAEFRKRRGPDSTDRRIVPGE